MPRNRKGYQVSILYNGDIIGETGVSSSQLYAGIRDLIISLEKELSEISGFYLYEITCLVPKILFQS